MQAPKIERIELSKIILDKETQPRAEIDERIVNEYRLDMLDGANFPPLVVFNNGNGSYYLADGWHRCTAARQINIDGTIECAIYSGGLREAILYSCKANADQGKRRSDGDKKRAIKKLLRDDEWGKWNDSEILRECKIPRGGSWITFVGAERKSLSCPKGQDSEKKVKRNGKTYTMDTKKIGKKEQPTQQLAQPQMYFPEQPPQPDPKPQIISPRYDSLNYELYVTPIDELSKHVLPDSIDAIITDPPYPRQYIPTYKELARQASIVLKPGGILVAMCGHNYIAQLINDMSEHLKYRWLGCYYMPTGAHASLAYYAVSVYWKPLLVFSKGKWPKNKTFKDVFINPEADKSHHEWGQGIGGFKNIIEALTFPNESVLDPFVGGGTTAIAALDLGRYFIGADISEEEIEKTRTRLEES